MPSILQLLNTTKIYGEAVLHLIHDCMQVLKMEWQLDGIIYIQLWRPEHPENYSIQLKWNPRNTILPWCYAKCCICQMLKAKQAKITHNKNEENEAEKAPSHHRWPPPPPPQKKKQQKSSFISFVLFIFLSQAKKQSTFKAKSRNNTLLSHWPSWMRLHNACALKPANTTLWIAPIRAQASMVAMVMGAMGR